MRPRDEGVARATGNGGYLVRQKRREDHDVTDIAMQIQRTTGHRQFTAAE